jgi:hypothetical protein
MDRKQPESDEEKHRRLFFSSAQGLKDVAARMRQLLPHDDVAAIFISIGLATYDWPQQFVADYLRTLADEVERLSARDIH